MKKLYLLLFVAPFVFACNQSTPTAEAAGSFNLDSAKAAITAANNSFSAAIAKGDSVAAAALYTKDACLMMAGMPKICGTTAITSALSGFIKMGVAGVKLTTIEVEGSKDLVAEEGSYELMSADGKTFDKGKYIVEWKQEDGKWKLHRDISSTDMPPPPPPPAKK